MTALTEISSALSGLTHLGRTLAANLDDVRKQQIADVEEAIRSGGFRERGFWSKTETYRRNDAVKYNGNAFVAITENKGERPRRGSKIWMLMAAGMSRLSSPGAAPYPEPVGYEILREEDPIAWNLVNTVATVTLTADRTLTMTNAAAGRTYILLVRQDAVGGHQLTWPSSIRFPWAQSPSLIATANGVEQVGFVYDGTVFYALPLYPVTP